MQKHNLNEVDKSGFPTNDKGEQVSIFDSEGNAVLLLNSNLIVTFPKGSKIIFNPKDKLEVRKALDTLVNILTNKFDDFVKGEFILDLTDEAKKKHRVFTKEPLVIPTVQIYFEWINGWLNYLGNCYNIEFKMLFYSKYKEEIKNNFAALSTGLNKHDIKKNYLEFAKIWLMDTDKNIELEHKAKDKNKNTEKELENINHKVFKVIHKCIDSIEQNNKPNELSIDSIKREQNNLITNVSIDEVFNHFLILTKTTNKNNEFYLTNEQLLIFINASFIECKPIKQDFNCNGFVKKNIRKVFYDFYFKNKNKETNQTKIKRKYFNIMNDAFNGFNKNDYIDFYK